MEPLEKVRLQLEKDANIELVNQIDQLQEKIIFKMEQLLFQGKLFCLKHKIDLSDEQNEKWNVITSIFIDEWKFKRESIEKELNHLNATRNHWKCRIFKNEHQSLKKEIENLEAKFRMYHAYHAFLS